MGIWFRLARATGTLDNRDSDLHIVWDPAAHGDIMKFLIRATFDIEKSTKFFK